MRALLWTVGVASIVFIALGLVVRHTGWFLIIGFVALVATVVIAVVQTRRELR